MGRIRFDKNMPLYPKEDGIYIVDTENFDQVDWLDVFQKLTKGLLWPSSELK